MTYKCIDENDNYLIYKNFCIEGPNSYDIVEKPRQAHGGFSTGHIRVFQYNIVVVHRPLYPVPLYLIQRLVKLFETKEEDKEFYMWLGVEAEKTK